MLNRGLMAQPSFCGIWAAVCKKKLALFLPGLGVAGEKVTDRLDFDEEGVLHLSPLSSPLSESSLSSGLKRAVFSGNSIDKRSDERDSNIIVHHPHA